MLSHVKKCGENGYTISFEPNLRKWHVLPKCILTFLYGGAPFVCVSQISNRTTIFCYGGRKSITPNKNKQTDNKQQTSKTNKHKQIQTSTNKGKQHKQIKRKQSQTQKRQNATLLKNTWFWFRFLSFSNPTVYPPN